MKQNILTSLFLFQKMVPLFVFSKRTTGQIVHNYPIRKKEKFTIIRSQKIICSQLQNQNFNNIFN